MRTGVQRRTLIGAGVALVALGAIGGGLVWGGDDGGSRRIADVQDTTTTEAVTTTDAPTTTVLVTTTEAPATTAAPVTTQPVPIEQQVAQHEQRISTLEATTTTAPPPDSNTTTTMTPTTVCYQPDATGDCDPANNG